MSSSLQPRAWRPPKDNGLVGAFARNELLASADLKDVPGIGPEDVLADSAGRLWCGLEDGRILRIDAWDAEPVVVADTGGRPLGLEWGPDGSLIVCDAERGLLAVESGVVRVIADSLAGERLRFVNNAAIGADGTIYFTDSSRRFGIHEYRSDFLEHSNTGRLLRRNPEGGVDVLLEGLSFANGVALLPDESAVLVVETAEYRISSLRLTGESAGTVEVFADNLPGVPDNLSVGPGGTVWAPLVTPRNRPLDRLLPRPRLRGLIARLPESVQPQPVRYGMAIGFDVTATVVHNLQDPTGSVAMVTGVREHGGYLYLGSLTEPVLGRVNLPA